LHLYQTTRKEAAAAVIFIDKDKRSLSGIQTRLDPGQAPKGVRRDSSGIAINDHM
jgi:hypothetical protein